MQLCGHERHSILPWNESTLLLFVDSQLREMDREIIPRTAGRYDRNTRRPRTIASN